MSARKSADPNKPRTPAPSRARSAGESLEPIVGGEVYRLWVEMLSRLGHDGRTHRLAVLVASMLQHAACIVSDGRKRRRKSMGVISPELFDALEEPEPGGENEELAEVIIRLFEDAAVPHVRTNCRGDDYSLVDAAIDEFVRWFNMPWED